MKIEQFKPEHLESLKLQSTQSFITDHVNDPAYAQMLAQNDSWTVFLNDKVAMCAGLIHVWPGHAKAWAIIDDKVGPVGMLLLTRACNRFFSIQKGRLEATVDANLECAHRWMKILGFKRETEGVMRGWMPGGGDAVLYGRII